MPTPESHPSPALPYPAATVNIRASHHITVGHLRDPRTTAALIGKTVETQLALLLETAALSDRISLEPFDASKPTQWVPEVFLDLSIYDGEQSGRSAEFEDDQFGTYKTFAVLGMPLTLASVDSFSTTADVHFIARQLVQRLLYWAVDLPFDSFESDDDVLGICIYARLVSTEVADRRWQALRDDEDADWDEDVTPADTPSIETPRTEPRDTVDAGPRRAVTAGATDPSDEDDYVPEGSVTPEELDRIRRDAYAQLENSTSKPETVTLDLSEMSEEDFFEGSLTPKNAHHFYAHASAPSRLERLKRALGRRHK